jgi:nitroreductase
VFATKFIDATVAYFETLAQEDRRGAQDLEMLYDWSRDVLTSYFEAVEQGNDKGVDKARFRFEAACTVAPSPREERRVPFDAEALEAADISIDDFELMAKNLKSVRWFIERKVERDVIDRAIDAARFSPSACNRQTYEIRVYDDPEMIATLASLPGGTRGFKENFPCLLVFVGRLQAFPQELDRHLIYIDASLAAMSLVFALESQQVGSCIINWPDIPEKEIALSRLMGLKPDERVVMMMAAGYPDPKGGVCWSQRKPLDEIRSYNVLS